MQREPLFVFRDAKEISGGSDDVGEPIDLGDHTEEPPELLRFLEAIFHEGLSPVRAEYHKHLCPYCSSKTQWHAPKYFQDYDVLGRQHINQHHTDGVWVCRDCGFWASQDGGLELAGTIFWNLAFGVLHKFSINDSQVFSEELGALIRKDFSRIHDLTWRQFEELIEDLFRNNGYSTHLTARTRDGGCDIILAEGRKGGKILVECKKYKKSKVSVGVVRELIGVQLLTETRSAKLVTTTDFTTPALHAAHELTRGQSGYELELINADELAQALEIYADRSHTIFPWIDDHVSDKKR